MSVTKVKTSESIFDIALLSGSIENVYTIIQDSGLDVGVSYDFTGLELTYPDNQITNKEAQKLQATVKKVITIRTEQSIFDLSLQYYGSVESVYDLIQNNSFIDSIIDDDFRNNELNYTESQKPVPQYLRTNNLVLATNTPRRFYLLTELGEFLLTENNENIALNG